MEPQLVQVAAFSPQELLGMGSRPRVIKNAANNWPQIVTPRGLRLNSLLSRDEWRQIDEAIVQATRLRLRGVEALMSRGLTHTLGSLGTLVTGWGTVSEMTRPKVSMSGRAVSDIDRVEYGMAGVPVPLIHKEYFFGTRELEAARRGGDSIDTANAAAAARVVAEEHELMLFNGSTIQFDGKAIYGLRNHPNRVADTATNFGGGDWGTITNPVKTIAGMIASAKANKFYGPYGLFVNSTQWGEAAMVYFEDGSGQTPMQRIQDLPDVELVLESDWLNAGEMVLVQLTSDVIDWAFLPGYMPTNVEWMSGDGLINHFKVISVGVPRIKTPQGTGKTGIIHATGA